MVRQGMAETPKRVWYLAGGAPQSFSSFALVDSKVVCSGGGLSPAELLYDTNILTCLTRRTSALVGLYVTRMTVSQT